MTRTSSKPSVVRSAVDAPLRSSNAFVATVDPCMTSAAPEMPALSIPFMMASSGCCGVESSLNISILPSRITTKSVNVPPVSTPILKVDLCDILDKFRNNRFDVLESALRVLFPCQRLKAGAHCVEPMNRDFAHPCEVFVRRRVRAELFDPFDYSFAPAGFGADLERGPFAGIDTKFDLRPPAGLDHLQFENCFKNVHGRKIPARNRALGNSGFAIGGALEGGPEFARMVHRAGRCKHEYTVRRILLERSDGTGVRLVIVFREGA